MMPSVSEELADEVPSHRKVEDFRQNVSERGLVSRAEDSDLCQWLDV